MGSDRGPELTFDCIGETHRTGRSVVPFGPRSLRRTPGHKDPWSKKTGVRMLQNSDVSFSGSGPVQVPVPVPPPLQSPVRNRPCSVPVTVPDKQGFRTQLYTTTTTIHPGSPPTNTVLQKGVLTNHDKIRHSFKSETTPTYSRVPLFNQGSSLQTIFRSVESQMVGSMNG